MNYHLDLTLQKLKGPSREQIIVNNQWAAAALDSFHIGSTVEIEFDLEGKDGLDSIVRDGRNAICDARPRTGMNAHENCIV